MNNNNRAENARALATAHGGDPEAAAARASERMARPVRPTRTGARVLDRGIRAVLRAIAVAAIEARHADYGTPEARLLRGIFDAAVAASRIEGCALAHIGALKRAWRANPRDAEAQRAYARALAQRRDSESLLASEGARTHGA